MRTLACAVVLVVFSACGGEGGGGSAIPPGLATPPVRVQAINYVKPSNTGIGDAFGISVALSADGNTLAVGAYWEDSGTTGVNSTPDEAAPRSGAVYVFSRTGGEWVQQAYVKASNTGAGDFFGHSVALSADGNTLAVGAVFEASGTTGVNSTPDEAAPDSGAAYVFSRSGGVWSQQAYVKASNTGAGDFFGHSVALSADGNTLAVAPKSGAGAVYVFSRSGDAWSQQASVNASNTGADDFFGGRVALSADGNTLAAFGASFEDSNPGGVYVFSRSGGAWSQQAHVKASNAEAGDGFGGLFGVALSADGNTLAVGAFGEDSGTTGVNSTPDEAAPDSGAVYVFSRSGGTWSQQAYVKASNTGADDRFGISVALSGNGNTLVVGADLEDSGTVGVNSTPDESASDSGAVYVFSRSGGVWSQQAYVKAPNTGGKDSFGVSASLSANGNTLAVGAYFEDGSAGGAYVYQGGLEGPGSNP